MFNRIIFQRIVLILIVLASVGLFTVVAFRYQTTNVPTLVTAIAKGDTVTVANLRVIPYPANALVNFAGLIISPADLEGKVAAVPINAGVPLTANLFGASNENKDPRYPAATDADQFNIKYYIPTDIKSSQGGVIRPGDYVDVIYQDASALTATFVLQKIHVVGARTAAGNNTEGNATSTTSSGGLLGGGGSSRATLSIAGYLLSVTPTQALLLAPLNPANIRLVQVDPESPNLQGVPSGIGTAANASPAP